MAKLLRNPSFEENSNTENWPTDEFGNQTPPGWEISWIPPGASMKYAHKWQGGALVQAVGTGTPEAVHKLARQLPPNEQFGQTQALLLDDGLAVYKVFGSHDAFGFYLCQTIIGPPGAEVIARVPVLGETHARPTNFAGTLEDDHFLAEVSLGDVQELRLYSTMRERHDIPGNHRPWNVFTLTATIPASGVLLLEIYLQMNWSGNTDFFIDAIDCGYVSVTTPPTPVPDPAPPVPPIPPPVTTTPLPKPAQIREAQCALAHFEFLSEQPGLRDSQYSLLNALKEATRYLIGE